MELMKRILSSPAIQKKEHTNNKSSSLQKSTKINCRYFGVPLHEITELERSNVPKLIKESSQFIVEYGLELEGIFRINGNARLVDQLVNSINEGQAFSPNIKTHDVMTIASLLKRFLRELPQPIIPGDMLMLFVELQKANPESSINLYSSLQQLINLLPAPNKETLKYVVALLVMVQKKESINKMSASSIGIVFGPNIFSCDPCYQKITNQLVKNFILGYDDIFRLPGELFSNSSSFTLNQKLKPAPPPPKKLENVTTIMTSRNNVKADVTRESTSLCDSSIYNELLTNSISLPDSQIDSIDLNNEARQIGAKNSKFIDDQISSVITEQLIGEFVSLNKSNRSKSKKRIDNRSKLKDSLKNNQIQRAKSNDELNLILEPLEDSSDSSNQPINIPNHDSFDKEMQVLAKSINNYKKKIRHFEEEFEKDKGIKPSKKDKILNPEIKSYILELSKARTKLKDLKGQGLNRNVISPTNETYDDESISNPSENSNTEPYISLESTKHLRNSLIKQNDPVKPNANSFNKIPANGIKLLDSADLKKLANNNLPVSNYKDYDCEFKPSSLRDVNSKPNQTDSDGRIDDFKDVKSQIIKNILLPMQQQNDSDGKLNSDFEANLHNLPNSVSKETCSPSNSKIIEVVEGHAATKRIRKRLIGKEKKCESPETENHEERFVQNILSESKHYEKLKIDTSENINGQVDNIEGKTTSKIGHQSKATYSEKNIKDESIVKNKLDKTLLATTSKLEDNLSDAKKKKVPTATLR